MEPYELAVLLAKALDSKKGGDVKVLRTEGVTTLADVKRLRDMGLYGAIIGKAYYAGTIDLSQAMKECNIC